MRHCQRANPGAERGGVRHALLLSVLVLVGLPWLMSTAQAAPLFAPAYHLYETNLYVQPVSAPCRDTVSRLVHVYMPCGAAPDGGASARWCHATSANYVTWTRDSDEAALTASTWYDKGGVRAGTLALNAYNEPTVMYTCVSLAGAERQCLAAPARLQTERPARTLDRLRKSPLNPLLSGEDVPGLVALDKFRDPTAWWRRPGNSSSSESAVEVEETWLVGFAASLRSADLDTARPHVVVFATADASLEGGYRYSHSLYTDSRSVDHMFEHPDFFAGNGTDAPYFLKLSSMAARRDYTLQGSYAAPSPAEAAVFTPRAASAAAWVDLGALYGSKTFWDPLLRRRRLWGWIGEDLDHDSALGWGGVQTLRDVVYNATDRTVRFPPIAEWKALRTSLVFNGSTTLADGASSVEVVANTAGATRHHEIIADFSFPSGYLDGTTHYSEASAVPEIGLRLCANANSTRYVEVSLAMPVVNATPTRCYTQPGYPLQVFTLPDAANDTAQCQAACDALPLCTAWDRVSRAYETVCVLYWQSSEPQRNCSVTTGRPNVPLLQLSRSLSGTRGGVSPLQGRAPLEVGSAQTMRLHIYVDDSVVEVFKDGGKECLTGRVYLDSEEQQGIWVYAKNIPLEQVKVDVRVFRMGSIWESPSGPNAVEGYANSTYNLLTALIPEY